MTSLYIDGATFRKRLGYAAATALFTLTFLAAAWLVSEAYFRRPPITLTSLDPPHLGALCPGTEMTINNDIEINDDIIVFYYVSTMDVLADRNYPGTQRAFTDQLHPHPATFRQELKWTVPDLPPGKYTRVFAVRNVGAIQDVVFIVASYEIKPGCPVPPLPH